MSPGMASKGSDARIASISAALRDKFGDRAMAVAESQAAAASGEVAAVWQAIVAHLAPETLAVRHAGRG